MRFVISFNGAMSERERKKKRPRVLALQEERIEFSVLREDRIQVSVYPITTFQYQRPDVASGCIAIIAREIVSLISHSKCCSLVVRVEARFLFAFIPPDYCFKKHISLPSIMNPRTTAKSRRMSWSPGLNDFSIIRALILPSEST